MKRREFMQLAGATTVNLASTSARAREPIRPPNVIVIIADDQGLEDFSFVGNPVLRTPHLDRFASQSVRFTDFHVTPVCSPTRAELLTGVDCMRNLACAVKAGRAVPRRDLPMMPKLFRQAGYATGHFGKWHLGRSYPDRPLDRGFDKAVWFKGWGLQSDFDLENDYVNPRYLDGSTERRSNQYCTDLWFDEALAWIAGQHAARRPFFTYIANNVPHLPLWSPPAYAGRYDDKASPDTAAYFAMLANLDDNIGRLCKWLTASGAETNTIVVYLSDNGGLLGRSVYDLGLRAAKGSHYEGGHRAPCFLRLPGSQMRGREISEPTRVQDLLPTLLDLCGVSANHAKFDGISLNPHLRGRRMADRMFVVQYGLRMRPRKFDSAVIWNQWRLQNGAELYDIRSDPGQKHDIATDHSDVVARMRDFYDVWWNEVEPALAHPVPTLLGSQAESIVDLTCADWWEVDCDNIFNISEAVGGPRGGPWPVEVVTPGRYEIELRRWPFSSKMTIGSAGPSETINGRELPTTKEKYSPDITWSERMRLANGELPRTVRAIQANGAVLSVDGREQTISVTPDALGARFEATLDAGPARLQGWFKGADGEDLCGAYYAQIRLS